MATFWETAAHSVDHMFSLYIQYLYYQLFPLFGFEGWISVLIASVPELCMPFTFRDIYMPYCWFKIKAKKKLVLII